jgi:hypothetical protein
LNQFLRNHTKISLHLKDKIENSKNPRKRSLKTQLLLLCMYLFLTGILSQDWGITLKEATKEFNKLYREDNKGSGERNIIEDLIQNKIDQAKQTVLNVSDIGNFELENNFKIRDLHIEIYKTQQQLNKKMGITEETTMVYSGESETWQISDYKIDVSPVKVSTSEVAIYMKGS